MGGLAACAGGAGIGALAFLALRALLAFGAFFSKARKARSARSVAARSVASATRQFTDAAADSLRVDGGRGGSGSVSERRKAFVAGKYSSVGRSRREVLAIFLWNFLQIQCRGCVPLTRGIGINFWQVSLGC